MGNTTFSSLIIKTLVVALFISGMFILTFQLSAENSPNSTVLQDEFMNDTFNALSLELSDQQGVRELERQAYEEETPTRGADNFVLTSVLSSATSIRDSISVLINNVSGFVGRTLGINEGNGLLIFGIFISAILVLGLLLGWKVIRSGQG